MRDQNGRIKDERGDRSLSADLQQLKGIHVLVVDDDADMRDLLSFVLQEHDAEITVVASAIEALQILFRAKPDILLCDIGMPDMDGYMLMRQVRAMPPERGGNILAIALTAYAAEYDQRQALAAGFQLHLAKPIAPDRLVKAIGELMKQENALKP